MLQDADKAPVESNNKLSIGTYRDSAAAVNSTAFSAFESTVSLSTSSSRVFRGYAGPCKGWRWGGVSSFRVAPGRLVGLGFRV